MERNTKFRKKVSRLERIFNEKTRKGRRNVLLLYAALWGIVVSIPQAPTIRARVLGWMLLTAMNYALWRIGLWIVWEVRDAIRRDRERRDSL